MKLKILSTVKTNNFKDSEMMNKIGGLWAQNENIVRETFQSNQSVFVVYHNYESDYRGDYSVSLCIASEENFDFDYSTITWVDYSVDSNSETGIIDTWKQIWKDEDENILKRLYSFDFEQYNADGSISIKISKAL